MGISGTKRALLVVCVLGATAVALGLGAGGVTHADDSQAPPGRLPEAIQAPGPWSDAEDPRGPLAAIGVAQRLRIDGVDGERESLELFGVSSVDGRAGWIGLPGIRVEGHGLVGTFALSPDGRWIGWSRYESAGRSGRGARLVGWSVVDTTTTEMRELAPAGSGRLRDPLADLAFSGDSRYLLTSYERGTAPRRRGHQFVAWDVETGAPSVIEAPGQRWLPNLGSAPTGVVWARDRTVYREDPAGGAPASIEVPHKVITASWGPDDSAFAYIGAPKGYGNPWKLYAGRTVDSARVRALPDVDPDQLLGWVDDRHVVVGHYRKTVHVVDIVSGEVEELTVAGDAKLWSQPILASDLWQYPRVPAVAPEGLTDPRTPWRWTAGVLFVVLAGGVELSRRRVRRAGD